MEREIYKAKVKLTPKDIGYTLITLPILLVIPGFLCMIFNWTIIFFITFGIPATTLPVIGFAFLVWDAFFYDMPLKFRKHPDPHSDFRPPLFLLRGFKSHEVLYQSSWVDRPKVPPEYAEYANRFEEVHIGESLIDVIDFVLGEFGRAIILGKQNDKPVIFEDYKSNKYYPSYIYVETSNDNWESVFSKITSFSNVLLIVPSDSKGSLYEMKYCVDNRCLDKTLVLMPPTVKDENNYGYYSTKSRKEHWDKISDSLENHGFKLPPYDYNGLLYSPCDDFSIKMGMQLSDNLRESIGAAFERLAPKPQWMPSSLGEKLKNESYYSEEKKDLLGDRISIILRDISRSGYDRPINPF